jgi:hypothetical protein
MKDSATMLLKTHVEKMSLFSMPDVYENTGSYK